MHSEFERSLMVWVERAWVPWKVPGAAVARCSPPNRSSAGPILARGE